MIDYKPVSKTEIQESIVIEINKQKKKMRGKRKFQGRMPPNKALTTKKKKNWNQNITL